MAPWPEPHSEPKAPDKTCEETCENPTEKHKGDSPEDKEPASAQWKSASPVVDNNPSELSGLDDRQLKALLDEAITYKCPKDREGKSNLFRELLQEVEADESECRGVGAKRGNGAAGRCRRPGNRRADVSERNTRGGSLQNLVYAINSDLESHSGAGFNRRRGNRRGVQVNVSARQCEGGSLPCNVNVDTSGSGALFLEQRAGGSRRQHSTVDDISAGVYGYKANSRSKRKDYGPSTTTVDDINTGVTSYRNSNCGSKKRNEHDDVKKRHQELQRGTVDDLVTANSRSSKRKDLKQLGHSSDDIYAGSPDDFPPKFVVDVRNEGGAGGNGFYTMAGKLTTERIAARMLAPFEAALHGPASQGGRRWPMGEDDLDGTELVPLNKLYARSVPTAVESVAVASAAAAAVAVPSPTSTSSSSATATGTARKDITVNGGVDPADLDNVGALILSSEDPFRTHDSATLRSEANGRAKDISVALYHDRIPHTVMSTYIVNTDCGEGDPRDKISRQRDLLNGVTRCRNDLSVYQLGDRTFPLQIFGSKDTFLDKKLDENGNAVQQTTSSSRKARKVKANNNENVYLAASLPGNRGDQDISVLVNYIESNSKRGHLAFQKDSKQRNSSSNGKRSDDKNRNDKRKGKLKKCNSLEEISRTKFSDLTAHDSKGVERRPKKQVTLDNAELDHGHKDQGGGDRRSWGPEGSVSSSSREDSSEEVAKNRKFKKEGNVGVRTRTLSDWEGVTVVDSNLLATDVSSADFHLVTKKQRKKKTGRSSSIGRERNNNINNSYHNRDMAPRHGRSFCAQEMYQYRSDSPDHQHHRRKSTSSMPPSDKSADSSDLDSVHSLPISPTTPRTTVDKTSTSSGSTPQASYADIARMASSNVYPTPQAHKWPSVGGQPAFASTPAKVPLWTANVTLHPASSVAATPPTPVPSASPPVPAPAAPASTPSESSTTSAPVASSTPAPSTAPAGSPASAPSQDAADSAEAPSSKGVSPKGVSNKRDAMTNTVSSDATPTESSVGNLLSDNAYPPLKECGKSPVNQTVKSFIYHASRSTASSENAGTTTASCRMANCVDVEHSVKRTASPAPSDHRSTRKPVIILDELETDAGVVGDPELTFGFEVNEQLLAGVCESSGEEEVSCPSPDMNVSRLSEKSPAGGAAGLSPSQSPNLQSTSTPSSQRWTSPSKSSSSQTCTPTSTNSSSGVESGGASVKSVKEARASAQPVAVTNVELQQIVAFVGEAWDEVMKNLSSVRGSAGPVKYYSEG